MSLFFFFLCGCLCSGPSWAHPASAEPSTGWSSATASKDLVGQPVPSHHASLLCVLYVELLFTFIFFVPPPAGVKIIGGYREMTGEDFGIFIKRVVAGGLAALDGLL